MEEPGGMSALREAMAKMNQKKAEVKRRLKEITPVDSLAMGSPGVHIPKPCHKASTLRCVVCDVNIIAAGLTGRPLCKYDRKIRLPEVYRFNSRCDHVMCSVCGDAHVASGHHCPDEFCGLAQTLFDCVRFSFIGGEKDVLCWTVCRQVESTKMMPRGPDGVLSTVTDNCIACGETACDESDPMARCTTCNAALHICRRSCAGPVLWREPGTVKAPSTGRGVEITCRYCSQGGSLVPAPMFPPSLDTDGPGYTANMWYQVLHSLDVTRATELIGCHSCGVRVREVFTCASNGCHEVMCRSCVGVCPADGCNRSLCSYHLNWNDRGCVICQFAAREKKRHALIAARRKAGGKVPDPELARRVGATQAAWSDVDSPDDGSSESDLESVDSVPWTSGEDVPAWEFGGSADEAEKKEEEEIAEAEAEFGDVCPEPLTHFRSTNRIRCRIANCKETLCKACWVTCSSSECRQRVCPKHAKTCPQPACGKTDICQTCFMLDDHATGACVAVGAGAGARTGDGDQDTEVKSRSESKTKKKKTKKKKKQPPATFKLSRPSVMDASDIHPRGSLAVERQCVMCRLKLPSGSVYEKCDRMPRRHKFVCAGCMFTCPGCKKQACLLCRAFETDVCMDCAHE